MKKDAPGQPQSVLVLGGGSDIAAATARTLVVRGCRTVVLAGRRPEVLDGVAGDLRRARAEIDDAANLGTAGTAGEGGSLTIETVHFDALDQASHDRIIADAFRRPGGIDLVLVAFAILGDLQTNQEDPESAARVIEVNFAGAVSAILAATKQLRAQGHGSLVVLSSIAAVRVRKTNFVYGASKAGLDGFTQGLADSLQGSGVHVLLVRPGFVATKMTAGLKKARFATTPEAVATAIVAGLESGAHIVWVPPVLRYVMGVMTHLPRSVFRRVPT